jgi:hypothetical protein
VERLFKRFKQFRRVATGYEKRGVNYLAMVTVAAVTMWLSQRGETMRAELFRIERMGPGALSLMARPRGGIGSLMRLLAGRRRALTSSCPC